jgi:hypothetical protein
MGRFGRAGGIAALGALPFVVACTSLGGPSPGVPGALNLAAMDLASAAFALDLPASIEAVDPPRITYGSSLDVVLVRADAEQLMGVLPAPAEGRSYAVYAFSPRDRAKVSASRAATPAAPATLIVEPRLCATPDVQKDRDTVTVIAAVPGQRPVAISGPETVAAIETRLAAILPACAGHSG